MKKVLLLFACIGFTFMQVFAQQTVTGTVISAEDGLGLPGVSVIVKDTQVGIISDMDGKFSITVPQGSNTLVFSFMGKEPKEVIVTGNVVNAVLQNSDISIDDVVITGYGVQKKREVTGAISQVKGKDLATLVAPSFEANLAGKSAGVQITQQTGVIGEVPRFRIRGISSISSGTYPLVVVDGTPVFTGDMGGYAPNNALGDVNPADIESVEILKDGSATALYGSRAANGVVLITTKKGSQGKMSVNYNNYFGFAQAVDLFDLLGSDDFVTISNEKRTNKNQSAIAVGTDINTDWQKAVLRDKAFVQDHNLSLAGGTDKTSYYFSTGYTAQEGVSLPNRLNRYTLRANLEQKALKWLTIGANLSATKSDTYGMNTGANSLSGNIFSAIRQIPNVEVYDANDPTLYNIDDINDQIVGRGTNLQGIDDNLPNIRYTLDKNVQSSKKIGLLGGLYASVTILPYLTFRTQLNGEYAGVEGLRYWNPLHGDGRSTKGRIENNFTNNTSYQWQNMLTFSKSFDKHNVSMVLVNENYKRVTSYMYAGGTDLSNPFYSQNVITGTYGTQASGGNLTSYGLLSYLGKLNYNYAGKYFLQASYRADGLSSLPEDNRWGYFPGVSVGWTISEESFMDGLKDIISDLKIRGSYAEVGNTQIGDFPYLGLYGSSKYADYNGQTFAQIANPLLKWETSIKTDIGLDIAFIDGRYKLTFDYYKNTIDGMILAEPLPMSYGVPSNSVKRNVGNQENWGYEFTAEAAVIKKQDFTFIIDANLTLADSKVKTLVNKADIIYAYSIIREGESALDIYGYEYNGVNPANGNPTYVKADGTLVQGIVESGTYVGYDPSEPTNVSVPSSLTGADKKILGTALPTYFGSFSFKAIYKSFDFNMMFKYSGGNLVMNRTRMDLLNQKFQNNGKEILGRWQNVDNPGDGWTPRLYYAGETFLNITDNTSTRWTEKGDFVKLSNIYLGYTLPKTLLQKVGIRSLKIFAQAQDFLVLTKYTGIDPEMESGGVDFNGTPRQRVLTFGLNLGL